MSDFDLTRRHFILGAGAVAFVRTGFGNAAEKPLFTAGVMSDTHVTAEPKSIERVRRAYRLFKRLGADLIINNGDICDTYCPEGYRAYRRVREETYPERAKRPREVFVWANHDRIDFTPGVYASSYADSFAAAKPILGIGHEMFDRFEMGGYRFLVYPQCVEEKGNLERYEREIAEACAASPGKPVFVVNHVPPAHTTGFGSGSSRFAEILRKYPQVVNFSGHSHASMRSPLQIWQDGYTCINFGCLAAWSGAFRGCTPKRKASWEVSRLEFYADRLVMRRHSLKDGAEIESDAPWTVCWKGEPRYVKAKRAAAERAPQFPPDATLTVKGDAREMKRVRVRIPMSDDSRGTLGYRLWIERRSADGWRKIALREHCGDFYREASAPPWKSVRDVMPAAFFDEGEVYRFTAMPYGFFGAEGRAIHREWTAGRRAQAKTLCDLSEGLPTLAGGERFELPEVVQKCAPDTKLRLIVDAESDCPKGCCLEFRVQCFPVKEVGSGWIVCEQGKVTRRYVLDFTRCSGRQKISLSPVFSPKQTKLKLLRLRVEGLEGKEE